MAGEEPIIALFDDPAQALRFRNELRGAGIPERAITLIAALSDRHDAVEQLVQTGIARSDAALFADEVCGGATLPRYAPRPPSARGPPRLSHAMLRRSPGARKRLLNR